MIELGELEAHWQDLDKRNVQVVVISLEKLEKAKLTQADFPHLTVVADPERNLAEALKVLHPHSDPNDGDTAAPTTILVDGNGVVRWTFRPGRVFDRLSPEQVTAAIARYLPAE